MKRNFTHNPAREQHKGRVNKNLFMPRFNPDFSESYDDTLADQSVELDQSTLSAFVDADSTDQSHDLDYSAYDSEETSFDEGSSGFQFYETDDDDSLSESLDTIDVLPSVKKVRRRTVISITRAGRCIDQIDMGALVNHNSTQKRREQRVPQKTLDLDVQSKTSPSSSILRSVEELSRPTHSGSQGKNLVCISRNLFTEEATPSSRTLKSVTKYGLEMRNVALANGDLLRWIANKSISSDFPVRIASHRRNTLSRYNPFSSLFHILIEGILKCLDMLKNNDSMYVEDGLEDDELPAVTIIYSDDAAFELSINGDRSDICASRVHRPDIYAYLEALQDDASNDSDSTPKYCHSKRVSWSPQLSCHFHA